MRIRLGQLEFIDPSPEELDELVNKYGISTAPDDEQALARSKGIADGTPRDVILLRTFVEAGMNGISVKKAGILLGRGGKAMRGAARQWASRVGLIHGGDTDPFDDCRVGTGRGIRIKADLQDLAKALLKGGS